jgi:hypothetical protein
MLSKILDMIGSSAKSAEEGLTYEKLRQQIRELAYRKWEEANKPWGKDREFWIEAEQELFGENPLQLGGYLVKSNKGSRLLICPINSEAPAKSLSVDD